MLLTRGFTLADIPRRVTWRALAAMWRWPWEPAHYLTADLVDIGRRLWWAKTEDGSKNLNPPEPIPRPGQQIQRARAARDAREIVAAAKAAGLGR